MGSEQLDKDGKMEANTIGVITVLLRHLFYWDDANPNPNPGV